MALQNPLKTITRTAVVRWIRRLREDRGYSVGVEFVDTSDADTRLWAAYAGEREKG